MLERFIKDLGGAALIAESVTALSGEKVSAGSIYNWPYRKNIPTRLRHFVARLAVEKAVAEDRWPPELAAFKSSGPTPIPVPAQEAGAGDEPATADEAAA